MALWLDAFSTPTKFSADHTGGCKVLLNSAINCSRLTSCVLLVGTVDRTLKGGISPAVSDSGFTR